MTDSLKGVYFNHFFQRVKLTPIKSWIHATHAIFKINAHNYAWVIQSNQTKCVYSKNTIFVSVCWHGGFSCEEFSCEDFTWCFFAQGFFRVEISCGHSCRRGYYCEHFSCEDLSGPHFTCIVLFILETQLLYQIIHNSITNIFHWI